MGILRRTIGILCLAALCCLTACKNDIAEAGGGTLYEKDAIIVLSDTFSILSAIDSCEAIVSQADSFLLGEIETDYGLVKASILTQLACPEGFSYPSNAVIDSVCLFIYYASWVGDSYSPLALNAYLLDRGTFSYNHTYSTDLNISDFCSRDKSILTNKRIVVASEKLDSIADSNGKYIPMLRMRLNDDFTEMFGSIRSFGSQDEFNKQFNGLLLETSFGSSTVLNISDIALGVYYHFSYDKAGRDTTVNDLKAFYANAEIRTINHIHYEDRQEWVDELKKDSDTYNYIIAPAGVYTRMAFPMKQIVDTIYNNLIIGSEIVDGDTAYVMKRPYVNKAQLRVDIENYYEGTDADITRNDWLQPSTYMLLIKEESIDRFFSNKELPTDTCAILGQITSDTDDNGDNIYYYSFDMSDLLARELRRDTASSELIMALIPVTVSTTYSSTYSTNTVSSVTQQQTLSATKIRSASNGMNLKMVYSGF